MMSLVIGFNYIACLCFHRCRAANLEGMCVSVCVLDSITLGSLPVVNHLSPQRSPVCTDKHDVFLCDALAVLLSVKVTAFIFRNSALFHNWAEELKHRGSSKMQ